MNATTYPDQPGFKNTTEETSARSAILVSSKAGILRERVMEVVAKADSTADECAEAIGESVLSVRPRLSELRALGKIGPTNKRRKNDSGHSAVVWSAVPQQGELL